MYNVVFQLVGNAMALVGLLILAYAPMIYTTVGLLKGITRPLNDSRARTTLQWITVSSNLTLIAAYSILAVYFGLYVFTDDLEDASLVAFRDYIYSSSLAEVFMRLVPMFAIGVANKFYYTTVVGVSLSLTLLYSYNAAYIKCTV